VRKRLKMRERKMQDKKCGSRNAAGDLSDVDSRRALKLHRNSQKCTSEEED